MMEGGKLTHSHSQPGGMDRTPPGTPKKGGKMLAVRVQMLDDSITMFQVQAKALGRVLFDQVCKQLHLLESDYFGLEYQEVGGTKYWLDLEKPLSRQIGLSLIDTLVRFCVKFYTPDPSQLEEEFTRYLFCLQIKRDLSQGLLQCNDNTAALMASYIVQAECGDYVAEDYPDHRYLSSYKFVPNQDHELERRIMENHKKHAGQSPAEADLNLLETARRCELYGIKMHPAKDHEGVPLNLAVAHMGIVVFQNYTKINTFSWAKIRKISFKRKRFLVKLHPEGYGYYKDTVEFFFEGRNECKNFWKKCVENHGFFRCSMVKRVPRQKTRVLSRGSSFRYSGRTQKQIVEFVRENYVKRQTFQRSQSFRHSSSAHSSVANVGTSISAHPLLPLGDNAVAGTPASLSCGSMTLTSSPLHTADIHAGGSPSPPLTTSVSPGTSVTSSPQHFYPQETPYRRPDIPKDVPETSVDIIERENNNVILSSTPLQNGKTNGNINYCNDSEYSRSPNISPLKHRQDETSPNKMTILSEISLNDQNQNESKTNTIDSLIGKNNLDNKLPNNRNASDTNINLGTGEVETRKKRSNTDRGYFIAKELLSTERTYKKDLEIINICFRDEVSKSEDEMPEDVLNGLFTLIDPLNEAHCRFLREIEQRLALWEGRSNAHLKGDNQRLGDIILHHLTILPLYSKYLDKHLLVLERLDAAFRKNKKFEQLYRDFELQRVCYLPISSFIMKPLQRLLHYNNLLGRLMKHYGPDHVDYKDCVAAQAKLAPIIENVLSALKISENFVQLSELQRDMPSFDGLLQGGREFIRQGCLLKHSKKGYQQRMFFLFSDILVYTDRTNNPSLQFKVHGQMPLRGVMVEESEDRIGTSYSFTIYGGNRTLTVAASSQEEKDKWVEDLLEAIHNARERNDGKMLQYLSLKSCSSSDEIMDKIGEDGSMNRDKNSQQRSNTTVHVCWHRNTSTSLRDHLRAFENELSGFLLRKFKNSNGWQKLWVVFTNFCLFFYKTYLDDSPLASLPLLGYTVTVPVEEDDIHKDYVFKLQFKNHVYFFRAESDYTFSRWMEVISSATQNSSRLRLFSRKDSSLNQ